MFLLESLMILLMVLIAPALAVRPQMFLNSSELVAIPFLSTLVVVGLQTAMVTFDLYSIHTVQRVALALTFFAVLRVAMLLRSSAPDFRWYYGDRTVFVLCMLLAIYLGGQLALHGFDKHDEIYSWNMWAIQHFNGEDIDYTYTRAPYPQLFPKLLSFAYMLVGSLESQASVKTALVIFPFLLFCAIGLATSNRDTRYLVGFIVLAVLLLAGVKLRGRFDEGMPDTLMSAATVCSAYLLLRYREKRSELALLYLACVCAVVAVLAKQPALIWALFSLPAIVLFDVIRKRAELSTLLVALVPAAVAVIWLLTEGSGFQDNQGVLTRSFGERQVFEQLWFGISKHILGQPAILLLLLATSFAAWRVRRGLPLLFLFVIPSMLCWLLFAAYDIRAGMPALLMAALVLAYCNFGSTRIPASAAALDSRSAVSRLALPVGLLLLVVFANLTAFKDIKQEFPDYETGYTARNNLFEVFGGDTARVYERIRSQRDIVLWAPTNYVYGLFYGYVDVVRPQYRQGSKYGPGDLLGEIRQFRPHYLSTGGIFPWGNGGVVLDRVATQLCPELFEPLVGPDNPGGITIYQLELEQLDAGYCAEL